MRIAIVCALVLSACPVMSPPDFSTTPALGPVAIGDQLVLGDADADALVVLSVDEGALLGTRRVALAGTPSLVVQVPGANVALVLSSTDRKLDIVSTDEATAHASVDLGAPFGGLAVSPDGDIAIAYYPPGTADAVFHNENEIALVDLAQRTVARRTLPSLGGAPLALHISPRVGARRYAMVLSDEHVAVLALDAFDMPERSVPLVSLTTGGSRTPTGVTFASDDVRLWAIVATREASSVYALEVVPGSGVTGPDFDVRLSQLAGITPGGAATLVVLDETLYTLTSSPSGATLTLTELATATGKSLALDIAIDHIDLFAGREGRPMALVWSSRNGTRFAVVDLLRMAAGANKAFETRTSREVFSALLPIPQTARFIALHADAEQAVSVIDADTSRVTGFGRTGEVKDLVLVRELGRLYLLTHLGSEDFMVSVDLDTLHPEVALVPEGADALALLPGVGTAAALAYREGGQLSLWPALATGDDRTQVVTGFLLDGLFQRH